MYFYYTATKLTTVFSEQVVTVNQIVTIWTNPEFQPYLHKQTTSCKLLCDNRTYYINEALLNGKQTLTTLYALRPGSVCLIKHIAVFNPASIDSGITLTAHTHYSSKCLMVKFWYRYKFKLIEK